MGLRMSLKVTHRGEPSLADKLAILRRGDSYPGQPAVVEAVETHMSWVFLTPRHAYKLKKPVRFDYLDFSTLAARRHDCEQELRLNRRLAPSVYLGLSALTRESDGRLALDGSGTPVEWLVRMRRLPADATLENAIRRGDIDHGLLDHVAILLAGFYRAAAPAIDDADAYRERLDTNLTLTQNLLAGSELDQPAGRIATLVDRQRRMLKNIAALLAERVRAGRIVEAHGDLRPEHIFLGPEPAIIDCLEFNREFRLLDTADELAFLVMECERLGARDIGAYLLDNTCARLGDTPPPRLLAFHQSHWAAVRARLALWHTRDASVADPARWLALAHEYLDRAEAYIGNDSGPD